MVNRKVYVAGVGMIPFTKPGASEPYYVMVARASLDGNSFTQLI